MKYVVFVLIFYLLSRIALFIIYNQRVTNALRDLGINGCDGIVLFSLLETNFWTILNPLKWSFDKLSTQKQKNTLGIREKHSDKIIGNKNSEDKFSSVLKKLADKRL